MLNLAMLPKLSHIAAQSAPSKHSKKLLLFPHNKKYKISLKKIQKHINM